MQWDNLTNDEREQVKHMVLFCLDNCFCMGMDEGYDYDDDMNPSPTQNRKTLTKFAKSKV